MNLNLNLKEVDTSIPVLAEGEYNMIISEVECKPSKTDETKRNLVVTFRTIQENPGHKPETVCGPHYPVRKYYPLQQSENPAAPDFRRDLALLFDAAFQITDPDDRPKIESEGQFEVVKQKEVRVRVSVRDDADYGISNEVKKVLPVPF